MTFSACNQSWDYLYSLSSALRLLSEAGPLKDAECQKKKKESYTVNGDADCIIFWSDASVRNIRQKRQVANTITVAWPTGRAVDRMWGLIVEVTGCRWMFLIFFSGCTLSWRLDYYYASCLNVISAFRRDTHTDVLGYFPTFLWLVVIFFFYSPDLIRVQLWPKLHFTDNNVQSFSLSKKL